MAKFNLIEEPWIPVLGAGRVQEVGLGEALCEAHRLERIETPSPLEEAALYRLLLAVLYRALPPVEDTYDALALLERGQFDRSALEAYLNRYYDRFFLFHGDAPFLQIPDLPEDKPVPWTKLLPELASGNNPTLFDHTTEENVPLASYAQAARALLVHQTFAPGGLLKRLGVTSAKDAPLARPAAFLAMGRNLFETLVLNLVPSGTADDAPVWELSPLGAQEVAGYRTKWLLAGEARVYTWPSRGVLLLDQGDGVREMAYGPGVEPLNASWRDPMVAYRLSSRGEILPLRLSMEKSFWRDFQAMLPQAGGSFPATLVYAHQIAEEAELPVSLRVLGQVSEQSKVFDIRREVYPLPHGLLTERGELLLQVALEEAEALEKALSRAADTLARAILRDKNPQELQSFQKSLPLLRIYWSTLDLAFPEFLAGLEAEGALARWRARLERVARAAWVETRRVVGTQGRHLRALAEGERALVAALRRKEANK